MQLTARRPLGQAATTLQSAASTHDGAGAAEVVCSAGGEERLSEVNRREEKGGRRSASVEALGRWSDAVAAEGVEALRRRQRKAAGRSE